MRKSILITASIGLFFLAPLTVGAQEEYVTVCILDSGCNDSEAEGKNYLWFVENEDRSEMFEGCENLEDTENHGTLVYQLLKETAPDATLYMLKCFDKSESADEDSAVESAIIQAIYDAVDVYHADIINMSWILNQESEELHEAIQYAAAQDVIMVAAAGNLSWSTPLGSVGYPAAWEEVIGVSGTDLDENEEPISSLWYLQSDAVFVSADGNYQGEKGSSFATPRITGILARYLAEMSEKHTQKDAQEYLRSIAKDAGEPGYDTTFGWGYVTVLPIEK